ncbi:secretion protein [Leptolyngbya sp. Heron Island J]|uniref:HlyD family secretion protein n=1 Tax=Leptolyngbya sp. Heron Island J TaxID=1385935 RepID=UPI0003B972A3|nr:HlyD family efflux transporter periplasmic adaptor subunit [Leptolyngbya sp. Heron Island J]ESA36447.1 secretion protein [Leptolyngbya sp. Heron Island J]
MNNDASSKGMFDLPIQPKKSTAIEPEADMDLAIEHVKSSVGTLAATQNYPDRSSAGEKPQSSKSPVVENFLPSPNRLLALGSLGLVGALGVGAGASTLIPYRTTVNVQAMVEPVENVQSIQSGLGGVVDAIYVQEHDTIQPGQEIATFRNAALQAEVDQIKAKIAGTEEHITQIDSQLNALKKRRSAETNWLQQLTIEGVEDDKNSSQYNASKEWLLRHRNDLETQLRENRNELAKAEQQIDNLTIRAAHAGSIYQLGLNRPGQIVSANETIANVVPDGAALEIQALVPATQIDTVEIGAPTRMHLASCAFLSFGSLQGQVTSVEPVQTDAAITPNPSATRSEPAYLVTVETSSKNLQSGSRTCELLPGMEGELKIITQQEQLLTFILRRLRLKTSI